MTLQAVRTETTIARILSAAESLFLERAYADVTMDDIAQRADVTKGALYHHFKGKEELYMAMMAADLEHKKELFTRAVDAVNGCRERLRALTSAYFALAEEKRDLIQLVRRDANVFREPARSRLVKAYQEALPRPVEQVVADGLREGELRRGDARLLAWHFVALVEVTLTEYGRRLFKSDQARLDHVLDLFFQGVEA